MGCPKHIWLPAALAVVLPVICQAGTDELPPEEARRVATLTAIVRGNGPAGDQSLMSQYEAAVELGRIGVRFRLPTKTMAALAQNAANDAPGGLTFLDTTVLGSGQLQYRVSDGPRVAFLMWRIRDAKDLAETREILWAALSDPDNGDGVRVYCIDELVAVPSGEAIPYLAAAASEWEGTTGSWYVAGRATVALAELFPRTRGILMLLTDSRTGAVARIARQALETKGLEDLWLQTQDVQTLMFGLFHEDWQARRSAAAAMGRLEQPRFVEPLVVALRDADDLVRQAAATSLGQIGDRRAVEPLRSALVDRCGLVRLAALHSLRRIASPLRPEILARAARDEDAWVRSEAVRIAAEEASPEHRDLLLQALDDTRSAVRAMAAEALGQYPERVVADALIARMSQDAWRLNRPALMTALARVGGPEAVPCLIDALSDDWDYVRQEAARVLGELGDERALPRLRQMAKDELYEPAKEAAAEAIRKIRPKQ